MGDREAKRALFDEFGRIGKALASGRRIELLDVLANGERTVEAVAGEVGLSVANASQHLQILRRAGLVSYPPGGDVDPLPAGRAGGVRTLADPPDPGRGTVG